MLAYLTCLNREFVTIIINHLRTMLLTRKQTKKILFTYSPFMGCTFTFSLLTVHFDSSIGCYYLFVEHCNGSAMEHWADRKRGRKEREERKRRKRENRENRRREYFCSIKSRKKETTGSICISRICGFFHFCRMRISTLKLILKR